MCQRSEGVVLCWKDTEKNGYLSNWAPSCFMVEGEAYNCVEQWIMANKARVCGDEASRAAVMSTGSPQKQKQIGRALQLDPKRWNEHTKWKVTARRVH